MTDAVCVIVGSDDEGSRVTSLVSWSARLFPRISGHHATLRALSEFFSIVTYGVGQ